MSFSMFKKKVVEEVSDTNVHWHEVQSSFVDAIAYDNNADDLYVTLSHGSYVYHGVPESVFDNFLEAPSKGRFFNRNVKDVYTFTLR